MATFMSVGQIFQREQLFKEKQGIKNAILSKDQNLAGSQRKKNLQRMYLI